MGYPDRVLSERWLVVREDAVSNALEQCGMFVLITTLMDVKKYPAKLVLEKYKGQENVERIFKFIKNPAWIGAFCLKKQERLVSLGYVYGRCNLYSVGKAGKDGTGGKG
ncbi:hypothetical protein IPdc08_00930 [archaeon]|nr:hypothetical protein IPdc08_00930 [archaeon]